MKSNNYSDSKIQTFSQTEQAPNEERTDPKIKKEFVTLFETLSQKDPQITNELIGLLSKLAISKDSAAASREESPEDSQKTAAKSASKKTGSIISHGHNMKRGSLPINDTKQMFQASPLYNYFDSVKATTREITNIKAIQPDNRNSELVHNSMGNLS